MMRRWVPAALVLATFLAGCGATRTYRLPDEVAERLDGRTFRWPVDGPVSSGFGARSGRSHDGVDILAAPGTEVCAAERGVTVYAGNGLRGYGNAVVLDHGNGVRTLYGHLRTIRVKFADAVPAGAVIGTVGRTGNATAYHLHFELLIDGEPVDPLAYLAP